MGLVEQGVKAVTGQAPKVVSPTVHAVLDYAIAGSMFLAGVMLWRRHRRAAIASIACGAAETALALLTDYPGGVKPVISYRHHGFADAGLATLIGSIPMAMHFAGDEEARWFRAQAMAIAAVSSVTDFDRDEYEFFDRDRIAI